MAVFSYRVLHQHWKITKNFAHLFNKIQMNIFSASDSFEINFFAHMTLTINNGTLTYVANANEHINIFYELKLLTHATRSEHHNFKFTHPVSRKLEGGREGGCDDRWAIKLSSKQLNVAKLVNDFQVSLASFQLFYLTHL